MIFMSCWTGYPFFITQGDFATQRLSSLHVDSFSTNDSGIYPSKEGHPSKESLVERTKRE